MRARPGCTAPSTGWASAPATPTSPRSRWRSARCTGSSRTSDSTARATSPAGCARPPATTSHRGSPLVGDTLFRRESGAVASQFHDPPSIEPYSSELVAAERGIVLGKKSGIDSIRIKAAELGLELTEDDERRVLAEVKRLGAEKRGLVTDDEFRLLVAG